MRNKEFVNFEYLIDQIIKCKKEDKMLPEKAVGIILKTIGKLLDEDREAHPYLEYKLGIAIGANTGNKNE